MNHYRFTGRSLLTARLLTDDGATWGDGLLLDERASVSYPDAVQARDGRIFVIYDRERSRAREILLAIFRIEDILRSDWVSADAVPRRLVNRAG